MATLEKIRSKSVLLIIVIGVALLAFIVGDAISNSRNLFGKGNRIAQVGDNKIEYPEFQQRQQELSDIYQNQQVDGSVLASAAIEQLIDEKLLDEAASEMGIEISDKDLGFYIYDQPLMPAMLFLYRNFGQNVPATQAYQVIQNPQAYGMNPQQAEALKAGWAQMEKDTRNAVRRHLYSALVSATIKPNALELADMHTRATDSYNVNLASKPFDQATLDKYKPTDAELKKLYEERKEYYKVGLPSANVGLAIMRVNPSADDVNKAKDLSAKAAAALAKGEVPQSLTKEGVTYKKYELPLAYINPRYANVGYNTNSLKNAPVDSVMSYMWNSTYVNVKKTGTFVANDTVELALFEAPKAQIASLTKVLGSGIAMDSVAGKAGKGVKYTGTQPLPALNPDAKAQVPANILTKLQKATQGEVVTLVEATDKTPAQIAYVTKVVPTDVYQFEAANYELYPSTNTKDQAMEKLTAFGNKNKSMDAFQKNAAAEGLQYQAYTVDATYPGLPSPDGRGLLNNTSNIVKWALAEATKGEVSNVLDNSDSQAPVLYIAVMGDEFSDYRPVTDPQVKDELTNLVKKKKAGADMVKQYTGKGDLGKTAAAMGVNIQNISDVRFSGSNMLRDLPVSARIVGTTPGAKVYVVEGDNGVYAYQVLNKNQNPTKANDQQSKSLYFQIFNGVDNLQAQPDRPYEVIGKMLRGTKKVENNRYELMGE